MKTFHFCFALTLCLLAGSFAYANPTTETNTELRKEVAKMIKAPELSKIGIAETQVFVHFTVNEDNKIIVLGVVADNDYLKDYVTESLNHRKLNTPGLEAYEEYNIRVSFRSEKTVM